MVGRPGCYITMDKNFWSILDDYETVIKLLESCTDEFQLIRLTDYDTHKEVTFRRGAIDAVREGGY